METNLTELLNRQQMKDQVVETLVSLIDGWNISVTVEFNDNISRCYHIRDRATGRHTLNFGYECMKAMQIWGLGQGECCGKFRGRQSIKAIACHEYAHAVQTEMGWRLRGEVHNEEFYQIYYKMLVEEGVTQNPY